MRAPDDMRSTISETIDARTIDARAKELSDDLVEELPSRRRARQSVAENAHFPEQAYVVAIVSSSLHVPSTQKPVHCVLGVHAEPDVRRVTHRVVGASQ
jgi:hypothetical protein